MDAHRRPDPTPSRTRSRTPRRLRVVRGDGGVEPARSPLDVPAAVASLLLPGLGQLIQGRHGTAVAHVAPAVAAALVWLLLGARVHVPLLVVLGTWMLVSAVDAARHRPRPPLHRV